MRLTVVSIFGGSDIVVPEGINVELSSFALFGGDKLRLGGADPAPGAPIVHVRCVSISAAPMSSPSADGRAAQAPLAAPLPPPAL